MTHSDTFIEQLVQEHGRYLLRLAYSVVLDQSLAEDVVQEAFISALTQHHRLYAESNYRAWLSKIVINRCRDQLRRQRARRRWTEAWGVVRAVLGDGEGQRPLERAAEQSAVYQDLRQAVAQLPEKYQLPILLRYVHNMTAPEIGALLDIKAGTVYSRLHTAIRQLERLLNTSDLPWQEGYSR